MILFYSSSNYIMILLFFIAIFFTVIFYVYKKKEFKKTESWLLSTVGGVVLLTWVSTFIYGKIFPGDNAKIEHNITTTKEYVEKVIDSNEEISQQINLLSKNQNKYIEEIIRENFILNEKIKNLTISKIDTNVFNKLDSLFEKYKYNNALFLIKNTLEENTTLSSETISNLYYYKSIFQYALKKIEKSKESMLIALNLDTKNINFIFHLGDLYHNLAEYDKAIILYKKGLNLNLKKHGNHHPKYILSQLRLGQIYREINDFTKSLKSYNEALEANKYDKTNMYTHSIYIGLGKINSSLFFFEESLLFYEKSLAVCKNIEDTATTYHLTGTAFEYLYNYDKAIIYHKKALNVLRDNSITNDLSFVSIYNHLGYINYKLANKHSNLSTPKTAENLYRIELYSKAIEYSGKALTILKGVFVNNHPFLASNYSQTGIIYLSLANEYMLNSNEGIKYTNKAMELFNKSLKIDLIVFSENHPEILVDYNNIASVWMSKEEYTTAIDYYKMILKAYSNNEVNIISSDYAMVYDNLGGAYMGNLDFKNAIYYFKKANIINKKIYPKGNSRIIFIEKQIIECKENIKVANKT